MQSPERERQAGRDSQNAAHAQPDACAQRQHPAQSEENTKQERSEMQGMPLFTMYEYLLGALFARVSDDVVREFTCQIDVGVIKWADLSEIINQSSDYVCNVHDATRTQEPALASADTTGRGVGEEDKSSPILMVPRSFARAESAESSKRISFQISRDSADLSAVPIGIFGAAHLDEQEKQGGSLFEKKEGMRGTTFPTAVFRLNLGPTVIDTMDGVYSPGIM
jgi:hypothetical protein